MGLNLEYQAGEGPVIDNPLRTAADVDRLREIQDIQEMDFVFETVRRVRADLPGDCPLIGFAGAPFTLASYAIEGGGSRNYENTKSIMYGDTGAWQALMDRLVPTLIRYLSAQAEAGCQVVQIFDSWAGCLSPSDYRRYVLPHSKRLIEGLPEGLPVIHFLTGNPALYPLQREAGGDVQGLDWRIDLAAGWDLEVVAAYRNVEPAVEGPALAKARTAEAVTFTAASAVRRYHDLAGGPRPVDALCIGPVSGGLARNLGFRVVEANPHSVSGLVEAACRWARSRGGFRRRS